nr:hypothetical protein Iba_scaffold7178CG0070 [Ipomoea batatas]
MSQLCPLPNFTILETSPSKNRSQYLTPPLFLHHLLRYPKASTMASLWPNNPIAHNIHQIKSTTQKPYHQFVHFHFDSNPKYLIPNCFCKSMLPQSSKIPYMSDYSNLYK